jgi:hypothetical protein
VVAERRQIVEPNIRERAVSLGDFAGPVDTILHIILIPAGNAASATSNTALQVNDHCIFWHGFTS